MDKLVEAINEAQAIALPEITTSALVSSKLLSLRLRDINELGRIVVSTIQYSLQNGERCKREIKIK